jgi:hypothetical protein
MRLLLISQVLTWLAASATAQQLGPAPFLDPALVPPTFVAPKAAFVPTIDTSHRGEVVANFYSRFLPGDAVAMQWSGSVVGCNAGTTSPVYAQATLDRINYYRAMGAVPDNVVPSAALGASDQQAALMFSANGQLSHSPPTTWTCYTAQGAQAAGNSNIALGAAGPDAIDLYMSDSGSNNTAAGHRRWILFPRQTTMGTGSVDQWSQGFAANGLWILDTGTWTTPPTFPNGYSWPSAGYFPYFLLPSSEKRWSFSFAGANFGAAMVSVTRGGNALNVIQEAVENGYGDNTIVWQMPGVPLTAPSADTAYQVVISNVVIGGVPRTFSYSVTVIDPLKPADLRDFTGKGKSDFVWRQLSTGQNVAWLMNGTTSTFGLTLGGDPSWKIVGVGDLNKDGKADVLWESVASGAVVARIMNGSFATSSAPIGGGGGWRFWAMGDFNGDGRSDIVWRESSSGATAIALMNGTSVTSQAIVGGSADWLVAESGDFDGDGKADLLWRSQSTGNLVIHFMNGTTAVRGAYVATESNGWTLVGTADFNGDGKYDLLWRNAASGINAVWYMNGEVVIGSAVLGGDTNWSVAGTGDFNGDGKADVLWRHGTTGAVALWLMNGTSVISASQLGGSNDWIPIAL